jgi:hypothetical protein
MTLADQFAAEKALRDRHDRQLMKWLRREVNRDLRRWRSPYMCADLDEIAFRVADCKAKLELLNWARGWQENLEYNQGYANMGPNVAAHMAETMATIMFAVRKIAPGYRDREGWRDAWA